MSNRLARLPLALIAVAAATSVVAADRTQVIALVDLQCVPLQPLEAQARPPECPEVHDGLVYLEDLEDCFCPDGFLLAQLTAPASFGPPPEIVSP